MNKVVLPTLVLCLCVVVANAAGESEASKKPSIPPLVSQVCKNAADPSMCKEILGKDPGSKKADLTRLTLISIRLTTFTAMYNAAVVAQIRQNKSLGVEEANCYKKCSDSYSGAVEALDDSLVELVKKNYALVKEKINIADGYEAECETCFTANKKDEIAMIAPLNKMLRDVGKNTVAVVDALQAGAKH